MECILQTLKTKLTCKPYRLLLTDGIPRLVFLLLSFTNVSFRYFSFQQGISVENQRGKRAWSPSGQGSEGNCDQEWVNEFHRRCSTTKSTHPWFSFLKKYVSYLIKKRKPWTSLVVQWLRIPLSGKQIWVRSLVRKLRAHMPWGN